MNLSIFFFDFFSFMAAEFGDILRRPPSLQDSTTFSLCFFSIFIAHFFFFKPWIHLKKTVCSNNFNGWLCVEKHQKGATNLFLDTVFILDSREELGAAFSSFCLKPDLSQGWSLGTPLALGLLACIPGCEAEQDWARTHLPRSLLPWPNSHPWGGRYWWRAWGPLPSGILSLWLFHCLESRKVRFLGTLTTL